MKSGIYAIVNHATAKKYIGSSNNVGRRWVEHRSKLRRGKHNNPHLQNAWNHYGEHSFDFVVLLECDMASLLDKERDMIATDGDYNIELDPVDRTKSDEHKSKLSASMKERYKTGYQHPLAGSKNPRMSAMNVARKGVKQNRESVEKRVLKQHKPVSQYRMDGSHMRDFPSVKDASLNLDIKAPNITMCCKGVRQSAGGFVFRYKETA